MIKSRIVIFIEFMGMVMTNNLPTGKELSIEFIVYYTNPMEAFGKRMSDLFNVDIDNYDDNFVSMKRLPVMDGCKDIDEPLYIFHVNFKKSFLISCNNNYNLKLSSWEDLTSDVYANSVCAKAGFEAHKCGSIIAAREINSRR